MLYSEMYLKMNLTIEAYSKTANDNWVLLPETTHFLSERQIVPCVGDAITLAGNDGQLLHFEKGSFKNVMTVKIKWIRYNSADIAVLLHYAPF